jgi:hypothetical protein
MTDGLRSMTPPAIVGGVSVVVRTCCRPSDPSTTCLSVAACQVTATDGRPIRSS